MAYFSNIKAISNRFKNLLVAGAFVGIQLIVPLTAGGTAFADKPGTTPGNNGTVKVNDEDIDGGDHGDQANNPHVGCGFDISWWNYDQIDDLSSTVMFELQAPTAGNDHSLQVAGDTTPTFDSPGGAVMDHQEAYTLSFTGAPQLNQGYHVKVTVETPYSNGNNTKSKVFWVEGCNSNPTINTTATPSSIELGQTVTDLATLSGDQGPVAGTVDFFVCGPAVDNPDCSTGGTQVGTSVQVVNGEASSEAYEPMATGNYCFRAEFTSSDTNAYADTSHTNLGSECFEVTEMSVPQGSITIIKNAIPNDPQDFHFTTSGLSTDQTGFDLDDDNDATLSNIQTFNNLAAGKYTVTESDTDGWRLDSLSCSRGATVEKEGTTVTITLAQDEAVRCTYTNRQTASITIIKDAQPNSTKAFRFTGDLGQFNLVDDGINDTTDRKVFTDLDPGTYTVTEPHVKGWRLSDITCEGGTDTKENNRTAVIKLKAGENVVCTFVNKHATAQIRIIKHLFPKNDSGLFDLNIDGQAYATSVGDRGTTGYQTVTTGKHSVSETAANGTDLSNYDSSYTCRYDNQITAVPELLNVNATSPAPLSGEGTQVDNLRLKKGDKVTCIFTNKHKPTITIVKDAQPDSSQAFTFRTNINESGRFSLTDDGSQTGTERQTFDHLTARNEYTFKEKDMSSQNWMLSDITCEGATHWRVNDNGKLTVTPRYGEDVVCTFVNVKKAHVTITKDAQPNSLLGFIFQTNLGGNLSQFSLVDNGTDPAVASRSFDVAPGTYTVTENSLLGWTISDIECDEGANVSVNGQTLTLTVTAGENLDCTFVNTTTDGQGGGHVLGSSTTAGELANTGQGPLLNFLAGALLILLALGARWFGRKSSAATL
jgi:hypothetical protein